MMNRFLKFSLFVAAMFTICFFAKSQSRADEKSATKATSNQSMKSWRKDAVNRQRRLIYNNDGAETARHMTRPSAQDFLDCRTTGLAGSGVDSIFYCTRASGFGMFTHPTKIGEIFTTTEGSYANNQTGPMIKAGLDPFQLVVDFCKKEKIEVFWSMRMNDNHDASTAEYGPIIFKASKWKNAHPEFLMGTINKKPKYGAWTAVNYAIPEVRERAFRFFEEVCLKYDIDGIELDYFRHPVYFKSNTTGLKATDEERAAMTELVTRIRKMTDELGKKRGRPILIAIRTPDSREFAFDIGLDVEKWMREDLLDLWVPAGTFQLCEWEDSVKLGHKHGIKVYPALDNTRVKDPESKKIHMTDLAYQGRASRVWAAGADGVYLYNFFDTHKSDVPFLRNLNDPQKLVALDRDYFACPRGFLRSSSGHLPFDPYVRIETLFPDKPKKLSTEKETISKIQVDHPVGLIMNGANISIPSKLRLQLMGVEKSDQMQVTLNGEKLADSKNVGGWLEFQLSPTHLKDGENLVGMKLLKESGERNPVWQDALIQVRH